MKPVIVIAFLVVLVLAVIGFVYHAIKLRRYRTAEKRCLDLTRFIRSCNTRKEWEHWRREVSDFLDYCENDLSDKIFKEYSDHLDRVLSDKLAHFLQKKQW